MIGVKQPISGSFAPVLPKGPSLSICSKKQDFYQEQILKGPESFSDCIKGISVESTGGNLLVDGRGLLCVFGEHGGCKSKINMMLFNVV